MTRNPTADKSERYEIRLHGRLESRWAAWFDGLTVTPQDDGTTIIHGPVVDQSALHGLLIRVRDTGLPLISVSRIPADNIQYGSSPTDPSTRARRST